MVLVGLLLIALICLALGLVLPSSAWLIASLIASAGAGYLLVRVRKSIAATAGKPAHAGPRAATESAGGPAADSAATPDGWPPAVDGELPAAATAGRDEVWVIDGRPRYHLADCAIIQGQDAEPIPYGQATEDGFMACSLCEPNVVLAR